MSEINSLFQAAVSEEFATFIRERVLSAPELWRELVSGARADAFWALVDETVASTQADLAASSPAAKALKLALGEARWRQLALDVGSRLRSKVALPPPHPLPLPYPSHPLPPPPTP